MRRAQVEDAAINASWSATLAHTRGLSESLLHQRVDGEWSFLETVRRLISVTDGWISGTVLGVPDPHHPMGVAASFVIDPAAMGLDASLDPPSFDVLAVREERLNVVRDLIRLITDNELGRLCGEQTVRSCVHNLLDEEWHHLGYANRDLAVVLHA